MAAQPSLLDDLGEEVTGIMAPVSLCMAVTVLLVRLLNPDGASSANSVLIASIAYQEQESDSSGKKLGGALLNALIFVGVIAGMTVILFLLFYYKCYKLIYAYMAFAVFNIFFFITGALFIQVMQVIDLHIDAFSLAYGLFNFSVVGTLGLLIVPIPLLMKQTYLIWVGIIVAYIFTFIPEWTSWVILVFMALYDIAAVLIPGGPLKALVELAIERKQDLPALIYEARPAGGRPYVRGWGNRRRRGGESGADGEQGPGEGAAAAAGAPPPPPPLHPGPGAPRGAVAEGSLPPGAMEMHRTGPRSSSRTQGLLLAVAPVAPVPPVLSPAGGGGAEMVEAANRRPRSSVSGGGGGLGTAVGGWAAGPSRLAPSGLVLGGESATYVVPLGGASRTSGNLQDTVRRQQTPSTLHAHPLQQQCSPQRESSSQLMRRWSRGSRSPASGTGGRPLGEGREEEGAEWQALPAGAPTAQGDPGSGTLRGRISRVLSGVSSPRTGASAPAHSGGSPSGGGASSSSPAGNRNCDRDVDLGRVTAKSHNSQEPLLEDQQRVDSEQPPTLPSYDSYEGRRSGGSALDGASNPAVAAGYRDQSGVAAGAGIKVGGSAALAAGCGAAVGMMRADDVMGVRPVAPAIGQEQLAEAVRRSSQGPMGGTHMQPYPYPGALPSPAAAPPGPTGPREPEGAPRGESEGPAGAAGAPVRRNGSEDDSELGIPDAIKLGLGDFIFYSMLVGRAAMYDFMTVFSSYLAIIAGLGLTLLCLAIFQKALPALPFSIALGVAFYFLTRLTLEPFLVPMAVNMVYY